MWLISAVEDLGILGFEAEVLDDGDHLCLCGLSWLVSILFSEDFCSDLLTVAQIFPRCAELATVATACEHQLHQQL